MRGLGLSLGQGHCVVFLGKTLYCYNASFHLEVNMGTSELSEKSDEMLVGYL